MKLLCFTVLFWIQAIFIPPFQGAFIEQPINIFCQQHIKFYTSKINIYVCPKFHYHLISIKDVKCSHKYIRLTFFADPAIPTYQGYYHTKLLQKGSIANIPVIGNKKQYLDYVKDTFQKIRSYFLFLFI